MTQTELFMTGNAELIEHSLEIIVYMSFIRALFLHGKGAFAGGGQGTSMLQQQAS